MKEASAFILLAMLQNILTLIPAPFNLTVSCHNFETIAYWNYSQRSLRPLFEVKVLKDAENDRSETIDTCHLYRNISSSVMDIDNTYYVNVTAVNASERSKSASSLQFSYDKYLPAEVLCTLDFPAVELSVKTGQITVTFSHPFQAYKNMPVLKFNPIHLHHRCQIFKYKVVLNGKNVKSDECNTEICKVNLPVLENDEMHCVNITGEMCNTYMTEEICQREEHRTGWTHSYFILIAVCIVMTVSVFAVLGMIGFTRKTKTMPPLPNILVSSIFKMQPGQNLIPKDYGKVQDVQIVWPVIFTHKELVPVDSPVSIDEPMEGSRYAIGQGHEEEWSSSQESTQLLDLSELSYTGCGDWETESQEDSGYDKPHMPLMEISPGHGAT